MLVSWQSTFSGRKHYFPLYYEDQLLSGIRIKLPALLPGRMSEKISSLDFQTNEKIFDVEWK